MTAARRAAVVIGDALLDVTARPATPLRTGADVPAEVRIGCGGQGANLAVRLARQGVSVELVCGLGEDTAAALVTDALNAEGVWLEAVTVDATGTVVIVLDDVGERTMLSQRASLATVLAGVRSTTAAWLVVSGYLFLEADGVELARALGDLTSRRVVVGCAVPELALFAWRHAVAAARPDLLVVNRDEALALAPMDELSGGIVVTDTDVVVASIGGVAATVRVPRTARAIDTTGAGDAFAAALVAGLMHAPWPPSAGALEKVLAGATVLASQVAHVDGAQGRVAAETRATVRS